MSVSRTVALGSGIAIGALALLLIGWLVYPGLPTGSSDDEIVARVFGDRIWWVDVALEDKDESVSEDHRDWKQVRRLARRIRIATTSHILRQHSIQIDDRDLFEWTEKYAQVSEFGAEEARRLISISNIQAQLMLEFRTGHISEDELVDTFAARLRSEGWEDVLRVIETDEPAELKRLQALFPNREAALAEIERLKALPISLYLFESIARPSLRLEKAMFAEYGAEAVVESHSIGEEGELAARGERAWELMIRFCQDALARGEIEILDKRMRARYLTYLKTNARLEGIP